MSKLKEVNFWLIYIVISIIIVILSSITFYGEWIALKEKYVQQLNSLNRITSQNTLSSFSHQEAIFKMLGNTLLKDDAYNYPEHSRKTIDDMLKINKSLVAFGLAAYNGQLLLVSNIKPGKKLPNLMKNEKSKKSFEIARNSIRLMLGRTYLLRASNTWGMPIRMAVENRHGEIPLVLTAGISLDGGNSALNVKELPKGFLVQVVRADGYVQFQNPIKQKDYEKVYNHSFNSEVFKTIKNLKDSQLVLFNSTLTGVDSISSAIYLEEFGLYTIVSVPYSVLRDEYFTKFILWVVLLFIVLLVLYLIFRYSINLQETASSKLKYIARHDSLTNLPNRLALYEEIDRRINNLDSFYLFFLDLDNFKFVNDTYGHSVGDELLKHIAKILRNMMIGDDYLARQSGDEFILLVNEEGHEPIRNLANKILETLSHEILINNNEIFTGVSIGISKYDNIDENSSELLNKADIALYKAKERKNSYVFFSEAIYKESKQYLDIELNLRKALKNKEFSIVYQPKIESSNYEIIGVEALIRWKSEFLGFVSPEIFIPIAEKSGVINDIGEYVIKKAQKDILDVWEKTSNEIMLSVNVSPRQINSNKDIVRFKNLVEDSSFPKEKFIIEVTENIFIRESSKTIGFLKKLRGYNIGVSLDDFGTGYSSLSILSKLPITEIKIDKSFVQNMFLNEDNRMLVKSIINIGRNMRLKVVAEGVENNKELNLLEEMGCEIYQGYYFSKPLLKEELIEFINNKK